ncbi:hypothetical protein BZA05DRAFT_396719 [Tricharina praecox]|uniref:uncharacterized protein n=1 Tax=Tricharina praecox TaxID=43433 RepID=UPI002220301F|nr:uncharacterized protein BZA05DRAFT_396719 [Tricharina praecox]KAI5852066.1 hypothetical protein BZA05DRAFT_396719 [Tricharina praecox]
MVRSLTSTLFSFSTTLCFGASRYTTTARPSLPPSPLCWLQTTQKLDSLTILRILRIPASRSFSSFNSSNVFKVSTNLHCSKRIRLQPPSNSFPHVSCACSSPVPSPDFLGW